MEFVEQGIVIDDGPAKAAAEKFVAAQHSSGKVIIMIFSPNFHFANGCREYIAFSCFKDSDEGICLHANCSTPLTHMVWCRIKTSVMFLLPYL